MAEWMPKSARPYRPVSAKPDVGYLESAARGLYQGAGADFADEQAGVLDAAGGHLKRTFTNDWKHMGQGNLADIAAEAQQVTDDYQQGRDESRLAYAEAQEANPATYGAGKLVGAVASGILTGGASALGKMGLKGALTAGALEGGAGGLGNSEADLTKQDVGAYARAFRDSLEGAAIGAPLGGVGYGVAKGVKSVGTKALGALRRARGDLTDGISAERQMADDAARGAEEKAARAAAKKAATEAKAAERAKRQQQKEFRDANEPTRIDKRYADPAAAPAPRAARGRALQSPEEFQFTEDQLAGFQRQARQSIGQRVSMSRGYREDLANPDLTTRRKGFAQEYIDNFDVSDPRAAMQAELRQNMAINLGKRGYSAEEIQRIVSRYAPDATPAPRAAAPEAENPALLRQRERGFGAQNMGAARYGDETIAYPNADIRRAQAPSGDPFHDAKTRIGLQRVSPPEGVPGENRTPVHSFEFRHPVSGEVFEVHAREAPFEDDVVMVDGIGPKNMQGGYDDAWGENANKFGPKLIRDIFAELGRAFPGRTRVGGMRATGANPGRDAVSNLPEVTQVQSRGAIRGANPPGEFERAIASRNGEMLPASGRRAAKAWETAPQTQVDGMPAIPRGMRRLYRGEAYGGDPQSPAHYPPGSINAEDIKNADGRWFTDRVGVARDYAARNAERSGGTPIGKYLDVPEGDAQQFRGDRIPEGRFADEAFREWLPPRGAVREAEIMDLPKDVPLGADEAMPAYAPFWERGLGDDVWPNRAPEEVGADDVTQRINYDPETTQRLDLGDAIKQGRWEEVRGQGGGGSAFPNGVPSVRRPEALPEMDDLTQPGRPAFPGDARTASPFAQRPALRQPYQPRSAIPAGPTQNLRAPQRPAPAYDPEASMNAPRDFDAETVGGASAPMPSRSPPPSPVAPELAPEPMQPLRTPAPRPTPAAPPSQRVMGAPPGSVLQQARPSVEEEAARRLAGGWGAIRGAFVKGASGPDAAALGLGGLALNGLAGGVQGLALRGALGAAQEIANNPAARAAAITTFRLDRLARVRPEVWARVGPTLQRAMQAGPERFKAERHVLLLRDAEFRAAEAEADAELERMDGQPPTRRAAGAR
jgi:hypothetical protein